MEKALVIFKLDKTSIKRICEFMGVEFTDELWEIMTSKPVVLDNKDFLQEPMTSIAIGSFAIQKSIELINLKFKN